MDVVLAFDIGGTNLRCRILTSEGLELDRIVIETMGAYDRSWQRIAHSLYPHLQGDTVVSVGVAVAGCVDDKGVMTGSGNLPDWVTHNLKSDVGDLFNTTNVVVLNDCAAAALGEFSSFKKPLIYVIWGTGVGVAVVSIVDGKVHVRSTELGHGVIIDRHSPLQCGCGGFGHLEAHVSGANMPQRFNGREAKDLTVFNWLEVFEDMAYGLRSLSGGDMDTPIILGGGVTDHQLARMSHRLPLLQEMVDAVPLTCPSPKLQLADHGPDSGLIGAGFAALQLLS